MMKSGIGCHGMAGSGSRDWWLGMFRLSRDDVREAWLWVPQLSDFVDVCQTFKLMWAFLT